MNNKYIIAAMLAAASMTTYAQKIVFSCDFEEGMPSAFTQYDRDGNAPSRSMKSYGITENVAWAVYDDGDNSAVYSGSWYKTPGQSNDWLVTGAIHVDDIRNILQWRAYALDANHPDGYKVYVSTTGNTPEHFTDEPVYIVSRENAQWTAHALSLAQWEGQDVYVAFVNDSYNCNILAIDDINVFSYEHTFNFTNTTPQAVAKPGIVHVSGEITSSGFMPVEGYKVELVYNDEVAVIDRSDLQLAAGVSESFAFDVEIDVPLDATVDYTLRISSMNGEDMMTVDESITCFHRTVLLEEGTGTWCMWCPRGAYGIELMKEKYPDAFVDIAVHASDQMMCLPYYVGLVDYFNITGLPGCIVDRDPALLGDPYYDVDSMLNVAMNVGPIGKVSASAQFVSQHQLAVEATAEFGKPIVGGEYGLSFIIVEDSVTGYEQANGFSGGMQEMGGFENLPDPIPAGEYYFANVGRMVYPSFYGDDTAFPAGTPRHTPITTSYTIDMPEVQRMDQVKVVAVITHMESGRIINVHETVAQIPETVNNISAHAPITIHTTPMGIAVEAQDALMHVEVWSIGGQLLYAAQPGSNSHVISLDGESQIVIVKAQTEHDALVVKCVR